MPTSKKRDRWDLDDDDDDEKIIDSTKNILTSSNSTSNTTQTTTTSSEVKENETTQFLSHDEALLLPPSNSEGSMNFKNEELGSISLHDHYHNPLLNGCRSVYNSYERLHKIDEGTYGIVWKARDLSTNEVVALKQIKYDSNLFKEGFPITALREISVLLALSHECIVTVREMVVGDSFDKVFMVMELMEMDLHEAMKRYGPNPCPQSELKSILHQILSATEHIHNKYFLHRDLKTSNILVHSRSGKVALCDFGLARKYQIPYKSLTQMVITLWYRPPELLFGETVYGPEVDMWSLGCIFGELLKKSAMLPGQGELDQIDKIFKLVGVPTEETWPEFKSLPNAQIFQWRQQNNIDQSLLLQNVFPINSVSCSRDQTFLDGYGFDLLKRLLTLNPKNRLNASDALNHDYFKKGVQMSSPTFNSD